MPGRTLLVDEGQRSLVCLGVVTWNCVMSCGGRLGVVG